MNLIRHFSALAVLILCLTATMPGARATDITPAPLSAEIGAPCLPIPEAPAYRTNMNAAALTDLKAYLPSYPLKLRQADYGERPWLTITVDSCVTMGPEAYRLTVSDSGVTVTAADAAGAFYGLQSLAMLARDNDSLPAADITDAPRLPYRGAHMDVSRHFFGIDHIMKQLDLLAAYKINRLHWHLTDSEGWRLEIPSRPLLTELAAWRPQRLYSDWRKAGRRYCPRDSAGAYGGYYTADDVRCVVEYARLRHITVIPEIEMPGHSAEVCAAYPELACSGKPYTQGEVCIGREETFDFFKDVLDEVMRLFPSHYIHIGGDEASRRHWRQCPMCQQRIREEGLGDEAGLQSYMIRRIEAYVNSHGRDIIGWDEILDGGLAPHATVMSWRNVDGGIRAARMGHDAIMTPEEFCYLDHPQDDPSTQPKAFGSPVTLFKAYSFDPAPDSLGTDVARHIIGVQGNNWAEYIPTPEQSEYMLYPRIIALAEVGWSQPARKDETSFRHRINNEIRHIRSIGYNAFTLSPRVAFTQDVDYARRCILVSMATERHPADIRYTTDGSEPTASSPLYTGPVSIEGTATVTARIFQPDSLPGPCTRIRADYHKAIGCSVVYADSCGYYRDRKVYMAGGDSALTDGLRGGKTYTDGRWQGFCPNSLDVTIDLGSVTEVSHVMANFMQMCTPLIFLPASVDIWASTDGKHYRLLGHDEPEGSEAEADACFTELGWHGDPEPARYIRFRATQGRRQFMFTDEIVIL